MKVEIMDKLEKDLDAYLNESQWQNIRNYWKALYKGFNSYTAIGEIWHRLFSDYCEYEDVYHPERGFDSNKKNEFDSWFNSNIRKIIGFLEK